MKEQQIICLIVAFGSRGSSTAAVAASAITSGADRVVIVDNGLTELARGALQQDTINVIDRIDLLVQPNNLGSAGGYAVGLQFVLRYYPESFIWLLDDDNLATDVTLDELRKSYNEAQQHSAPILLSTFRPRRPYMKRLAEGASQGEVFTARHPFAGLDVLGKLRTKTRRSQRATPSMIADMPVLPYAPYGGLFGPIGLIMSAGQPNVDLFLYEDDTEFTSRLVRSGVCILLCLNAVLNDGDDSWYLESAGNNPIDRYLLTGQDFRVFYTLRNRVYLERTARAGRTIDSVFASLNGTIFLAFLFFRTLRTRRFRRAALILRALKDGFAGRLGETFEIKQGAN